MILAIVLDDDNNANILEVYALMLVLIVLLIKITHDDTENGKAKQ